MTLNFIVFDIKQVTTFEWEKSYYIYVKQILDESNILQYTFKHLENRNPTNEICLKGQESGRLTIFADIQFPEINKVCNGCW